MVTEELIQKYLLLNKGEISNCTVTFKGMPPPDLDKPFTSAEVRRELNHLNIRSASSLNGVTNKALRNLDERLT